LVRAGDANDEASERRQRCNQQERPALIGDAGVRNVRSIADRHSSNSSLASLTLLALTIANPTRLLSVSDTERPNVLAGLAMSANAVAAISLLVIGM
jgi:hypothetical protein